MFKVVVFLSLRKEAIKQKQSAWGITIQGPFFFLLKEIFLKWMERAKKTHPKDESSGIKAASCEMSYKILQTILSPLKLQHPYLRLQEQKWRCTRTAWIQSSALLNQRP